MIGDILQPTHLLLILLVALVVLGPKRLPEVGRAVGRSIHDFKGAINGYVLLRVSKIAPAVSHSLDEVKDKIKQQLALQLAGAKITDMVNAFEDARSGGADLATAAKKVGMRSGRIAAVDRNGLGLDGQKDRKSTRLNSSHLKLSRMPSSA